jgi:hypothetical protein
MVGDSNELAFSEFYGFCRGSLTDLGHSLIMYASRIQQIRDRVVMFVARLPGALASIRSWKWLQLVGVRGTAARATPKSALA